MVLVAASEEDIRAHGGWPLSDEVLARVLETLGSLGARVVGLDIYRDLPVPPGNARLEAVLRNDRRIIGIMQFRDAALSGVPPPPSLRDTDRVGFSDILVDPGGTVRRGLLYMDDGRTTATSFGLRVALGFLEAEGVTPQPDPREPSHLRLGRTTIPPFEANDGPYVGADAGGYQFLLDFGAGRNAFATVPLGDVLSGALAPDTVRDKVVLVGVAAASVHDHFDTPISRGREGQQEVAGLVIHAHVVSQVLRMALDGVSPLATAGSVAQAAWVALWGGLGGLVGLRIRTPWGLSAIGLVGLVVLAAVDFVLFLLGWWIPLVPPAITWVGSAALVTAVMAYREAEEQTALMRLFSVHVSKEVAGELWERRYEFLDGQRPRPQRFVATALFADLAGFTRLAEAMSPEVVMDWLNEFMAAMAHEVSTHGGFVRQYAGDSIVAFFGVPVPRTTDAEIAADAVNAVSCALDMEATLRGLNARWRAEGRPPTAMRVGIYTGPVVAGSLGSTERIEYVVVGDAVNPASRLEAFDKSLFAPDAAGSPCRILIGEPTLGCLGDRFLTERIGEVAVKGRAARVGIYRVTGRAPAVVVAVPA
jgi:adenylate cyclase